MFLHRLHLNLRSREVRRDLADPYQMHASLCRAFASPDQACAPGTFLWRLEPERGPGGSARVLVQSTLMPEWDRMASASWLAHAVEPPLNLEMRLGLASLEAGRPFRFRLRANPSTSLAGRRIGHLKEADQVGWLVAKGQGAGFSIPQVHAFDPFQQDGETPPVPQVSLSQAQMLRGRQFHGNRITVFSVLFEGLLEVTDPACFRGALERGIGHGKALGLGLLSVVPLK